MGIPGGKVIGAFRWGAEYQPLPGVNLGGCENRSFFGSGGDVLPVAEAFGRLAAAAATERQLGSTRSYASMALERGGFGADDNHASGPADRLAAGHQCRAKHGDDIQPYLA